MSFIQRFEFGYHFNGSGKDAKKSDSGKALRDIRQQPASGMSEEISSSDKDAKKGLGSGLCSLSDV